MLCRQIQASFCLSRDLAGGTVSIFIICQQESQEGMPEISENP